MERARDLGIEIGDLPPGPLDAITDVGGVRVGHTTLVEGASVRTGVTVLVPGELPVFAGSHRLNGNGELTGLEWVRESGMLTTPVGLTNTYSVGVVRDELARLLAGEDWDLPVVGETWDGFLNDIQGQHVRPEHVEHAWASAAGGPVTEGNVGGGTGMVCHQFKGGIGTASRLVDAHVVGVLVQANYGRRERFRVDGVPVGRAVAERIPLPGIVDPDGGSIIVVIGTDAPLLPGQCDRLAQRAGLGIGRMGGTGAHTSGDLFLCFATGNRVSEFADAPIPLTMVPQGSLTPYFEAVIEATEEAILNALLAAETMTGRDGNTAHRLEPELLLEAMGRFRPQ
jgi:D-aminopeptidase